MISQLCKQFFSTIKYQQDLLNKTITLTLINPKKRNTLSSQTMDQFLGLLEPIKVSANKKQAKVVIIKAQGPVFSSGHDLKQLATTKHPQKIFQKCCDLMLGIKSLPIPTLCVVNGIAAAAGFQFVISCDLLIATTKSTFSCPGVKLGLFCSTPGVQLIRSINSQKKAMEMLLFGQSITAQQAYQYGLVNKVVQENKIQEEVNDYVKKINNLSGEVIALGKRVLAEQRKLDIKQAYCKAVEGMTENIKQKSDCKQGLASFSQKRHPHFKN